MNALKNPQIFVKNLFQGIFIALVILLIFEGFLRLYDFDYRIKTNDFRNENDPDHSNVTLPDKYADKISISVYHNLVTSKLTYPDKELIFRVKENPQGTPVHGYTGINSLGFRGPEFKNNPGKKSIAVVGNSCVFGWNIKDHTNTFPYKLQSQIDEDSLGFVVYNLGQPGYSTTQSLKLLEMYHNQIKPDIQIIYMGWNDVWETPLLTDTQTMLLLAVNDQALVRWLRQTYIYGMLEFFLNKLGIGTQEPVSLEQTLGFRPRVPMHETVENFEHMLKMAPITYMIIPPFCCEQRLKPMEQFGNRLRAEFGNKVKFIPLDSMQYESASSGNYFQEDGFHPDSMGAEYIYQSILQFLKQDGIF